MIGILHCHIFKAYHSAWHSVHNMCLYMLHPLPHFFCTLYQIFGMLIKFQLMTSSPQKNKVPPRNVLVICFLHFSRLPGYCFLEHLPCYPMSDNLGGYCLQVQWRTPQQITDSLGFGFNMDLSSIPPSPPSRIVILIIYQPF